MVSGCFPKVKSISISTSEIFTTRLSSPMHLAEKCEIRCALHPTLMASQASKPSFQFSWQFSERINMSGIELPSLTKFGNSLHLWNLEGYPVSNIELGLRWWSTNFFCLSYTTLKCSLVTFTSSIVWETIFGPSMLRCSISSQHKGNLHFLPCKA